MLVGLAGSVMVQIDACVSHVIAVADADAFHKLVRCVPEGMALALLLDVGCADGFKGPAYVRPPH